MEKSRIIDDIITSMYETSYLYQNKEPFTSITYIDGSLMNHNGIMSILNHLLKRDESIKIIEKENGNNMNYKIEKDGIIYNFNPCFYIDNDYYDNNEYIIKISIMF